ncbi:MAG TPA: Zn-ribbon domain-containing OB-fold protein [Caulobacteraceae bacterium]|nr:Zn-ribbon domain-containing OB-fold protein [Caulobacteraceae bacterium]
MSGERFDLPTVELETRAFWDAASGGVLMLGKCGDCGRLHYYPRPMCPYCWSENVTLTPASGRGVIYTYSTVYVNDLPPFRERLPYVAAQVDLEEGLRITTNIVDCPAKDLSIGLPVTARFNAISDEVTIAVFRPAAITRAAASRRTAKGGLLR